MTKNAPDVSVTSPAQPAPVTRQSTDAPASYVLQISHPLPNPVPPDFWDKWGPAALALLGVMLTLALKWWLDEKKRKFDAKRVLYLDVADALHEGSALFGSFGNTRVSLADIMSRFETIARRLSKAEMVAGDKLLRALANLKNFGGRKYGEFLNERMKAERHASDINANAPVHQKIQADIEWCLTEQQRFNVDGPHDQAGFDRFQRLQAQFEFLQRSRQELIDKDGVSHAQILVATKKLVQMSTKFAKELIPMHVEVLAQMRNELDFSFDVKGYRALQEDMAIKAAEMVEQTMKGVQKAFELEEPIERDRG